MDKNYNILVTGVGAIIGYGIIESLKYSNISCRIIGIDINKENFGKYKCDKFYQVPLTNSSDYTKYIQTIIAENNIELIFPGIEQDMFFFNQHKHLFNTQFVINEKQLINLSKDKLLMYEYLLQSGFKELIPTFEFLDFSTAKDKLGLPFIIKPKSSYASKGFYIIKSENDFFHLREFINNETLFQPYIGSEDDEYTISVFGNGQGGFIDHLILRRYLSKQGASERTIVIEKDHKLMDVVSELTELFKPVGPTNYQFRKQDDKVFLLEINPRISSACSIRTKFGYNEPLFAVQHYLEKQQYTILRKRSGKAVRFIADQIIYE